MITKHTPGKWIGIENQGVYLDENMETAVFETGCGCCTSNILSKADAQLIASAPDMLKTLEIAYNKSINMELRDLLRVIIHKATGEYI
jgi:hypothetical protein